MAEQGKEYEKEPLLAQEDDQLTKEKDKAPDNPLYTVPPPAYEPPTKPVVIPIEFVKTGEGAAELPLPTYDQSEKYEKEGVLELNDNDTNRSTRSEGTIRIFTRQFELPPGTWGEFAVFFIVCLLFSWVGYIFACCLAVTIAAQSGAASGLGLSLIIKTIFVEFRPDSLTNIVQNMCSEEYYYGNDGYSSECTARASSFLRLMFWILGFLGLFLFARGISVFSRTRGERVRTSSS